MWARVSFAPWLRYWLAAMAVTDGVTTDDLARAVEAGTRADVT